MARRTTEVSLQENVAAYTELLLSNPRSTVFLSLCDTYRRMGLMDEALETARRGVSALPHFCGGHIMLGRLLAETGDLEGAEESYSRALQLDPENLPALKGLARVSFRRGDRTRTRELLQRAHSLNPEDPVIRQMFSFFSEKPEGERHDLPPVSAAKPAEPIATPTIAEIYLKQGLPSHALQVYRDLLRRDPQNEKLRLKLQELEASLLAEEASEALSTETIEAPPVAVSLPVRQIELLTRWVEAARRRRTHVQ